MKPNKLPSSPAICAGRSVIAAHVTSWRRINYVRPLRTRMKRISLYLLFAVAIQNFCFADVTMLTPEDSKALEDSSRFHEILVTTNLPPAILALCANGGERLAEPGQKWQETDVITNSYESLPFKRLIWAAVSGEYYVVHYERGGRAHSFHVLVAILAKGEPKPKVVLRSIADERLKDYSAFLDALRSGKLYDWRNFAH